MYALSAFVLGALFSLGLVISGMTQPAKIVGFLDFTGHWDPTLALVMGGALAVYMPAFHLITRRKKPVLAGQFFLPKKTEIDLRLTGGAALFGIGWGLAGYCPAPAVTALPSLSYNALGVVSGMVLGILATRWVLARAGIRSVGRSPPGV